MKGLEKLEISFPSELLERMDRVGELLGVEREELVRCAVRRFVDRFVDNDIKVRL